MHEKGALKKRRERERETRQARGWAAGDKALRGRSREGTAGDQTVRGIIHSRGGERAVDGRSLRRQTTLRLRPNGHMADRKFVGGNMPKRKIKYNLDKRKKISGKNSSDMVDKVYMPRKKKGQRKEYLHKRKGALYRIIGMMETLCCRPFCGMETERTRCARDLDHSMQTNGK